MGIKGLKIDNNSVFALNEKEEWEAGTASIVPDLKRILSSLEQIQYPKKIIRENVIFGREYSTGMGIVKSFKDEDGDLVYEFQKGVNISATNTEVNEDLEFGIEEADNSKDLVNFWTSSTSNTNQPKQNFIEFKKNSNIQNSTKKENLVTNTVDLLKKKDSRRVVDVSYLSPVALLRKNIANANTNSQTQEKLSIDQSNNITASSIKIIETGTRKESDINNKQNSTSSEISFMKKTFQAHKRTGDSFILCSINYRLRKEMDDKFSNFRIKKIFSYVEKDSDSFEAYLDEKMVSDN